MDHKPNRDSLVHAGACEHVGAVLQNHAANESAAGEACWAMRNLASSSSSSSSNGESSEEPAHPSGGARLRFYSSMAPESILSSMKSHFGSEAFMVQALQAVLSLISADSESSVMARMSSIGTLSMALKSAKKLPDSDSIAQYTLQLIFIFSCDDTVRMKLAGLEILDAITAMIQAHANTEGVSEFGCRAIYQLTRVGGGVYARMRTAGLLETTVGAIQRQAMSEVVAEYGPLALGALAADPDNLYRLIGAGAGAAMVSGLRQHKKSAAVVSRTSYAIHYLAQGDNNVSWLGACGTCEAIIPALDLHTEGNAVVAHMGCRAIGSLAYHDEGNINKLKSAGVAALLSTALKTHISNANVAEHSCRAIYNLCLNSSIVSEFGHLGVCECIVNAANIHKEHGGVVTYAVLAIGSLAVKRKNEKVNNANMRKLVSSGAIELVLEAATSFPNSAAVLRSTGLAIASLARLETYSGKLGALGAPRVILRILASHKDNPDVTGAMFSAVNSLCQVEANRMVFASNGIIAIVFAALFSHEKSSLLVAEGFRILSTVAVDSACRKEMVSENQLKLVTRVIKLHEKLEFPSKWGATFIFTLADNDEVRATMGRQRACEVLISVLAKNSAHGDAAGGHDDEHGEHEAYNIGASVTELVNRAIVALCLLEENRSRFVNSDSCEAVVNSLKS